MSTRVVAEWTRSSARLAVCEGTGGRFRLRAIHAQPLAAGEAAGPVLRSLAASARVPRAEAIGVIPREQVLTRIVKFPSMKPEELKSMVALYAKGQLPYPKEQAVVDFHLLAQRDGSSIVAIVACQREVVDRTLAVLREAQLSPIALTVSSWGVLGWYRCTLVLEPSREPALVINVDDSRTDLVVVSEGRLLTSRSVGQGRGDWTGSADAVELLATEAERTHAAVKKELPGLEVRSVVITGLGDLAAWRDALSARLGLPAEAVEPPPENHQPACPGSGVVIGGLAAAEVPELLNLGTPELRARVRHRRQFRELAAVSAMLAGVLILGAGLSTVQRSRETRRAAQIDRVLTGVEPQAKRLREKIRVAELADGVLKHRRQLAAVLSGLLRVTPPTVILEGLSFDRGRSELELRGSADSTQAILDYAKALAELEKVASVELKRSTRRSGASGDRADFELLLRLNAPPHGRPG